MKKAKTYDPALRESIVRLTIGKLNDGPRRMFLLPSELRGRDVVVNSWVRGDLAKDARNLQWCPPNYEILSDQAPISYRLLKEEYLEYRFVGLPAPSSAFDQSNPSVKPFADVPKESLGPWCVQFAHVIEGMIEATVQLLSVEVQLPLLTQTAKRGWCVDCYCESCQTRSSGAVMMRQSAKSYAPSILRSAR